MTAVSMPPSQTGHPRRRAVAALMSAAVIMVVSLVAAINLAIPKLSAGGLNPSPTGLLWIVDSYVIVFACLLIPAGAVGDRLGRKRVLLAGLAIFIIGCLISAAAPAVAVLIAGRAITGVGAAMIMPATLSLTVAVFAPAERPAAIAGWTAATGVAGIIGNVGGGLVLEYLPWQALFLTPVPIAAALALLAARVAPAVPRHPADLDPAGSALLVVASVALLYGIIEGPELGWGSAQVLCGFGVAAILFTVFVLHQLRTPRPLLDPRIFLRPRLRAGVLGVTTAFFGLFALFFVNAQYLQNAKGFSPLTTGVAILPLAIAMFVTSRRSVPLAARFGTLPVVTTGLLGIVTGLGLLSLAGPATPYPVYALYLLVMGTSMGLCVPVLSVGVIAALPPERAGMGSGLNSAGRELGSALGVAVIGTAMSQAGTGVGYRVIAVAVLAGAAVTLRWMTSALPSAPEQT
ncbi:MFS transporter [Streptosporangium sp. NPDC000396]|uniref:MFS transporter n=1 Tax=Streptosporangium sp. NPDC000396 TaxID=3366185 RepID=UPI00368B6579